MQLPLLPLFPDAAEYCLHCFFGLCFVLQYRKGIGLQLTVPRGKQGIEGGYITCPDLFRYQAIVDFQIVGLKWY